MIETLITAHRAARAAVRAMDAVSDGPAYDSAVEGEEALARALAEIGCTTTDEDFFAAASAILERDILENGPPKHEDRFGSLAILVANRLGRRWA
jgi:hypothetical protein